MQPHKRLGTMESIQGITKLALNTTFLEVAFPTFHGHVLERRLSIGFSFDLDFKWNLSSRFETILKNRNYFLMCKFQFFRFILNFSNLYFIFILSTGFKSI